MARDPYKYFREEGRDLIEQIGKALLDLERGDGHSDALSRLLRSAHTLKGAARVVRLPVIANIAHAIEDALVPFRDAPGTISRAGMDEVLSHIDSIATQIAALSTQDVAPSEARTARDGAEAFRSVRADVAEIDALLDGLGEIHAQMPALDEVGTLAEKAGRLCDLIAGQLAAPASHLAVRRLSADTSRTFAAVEELRDHVAQIRQRISGIQERTVRELREVRVAAEQLRLLPVGRMLRACERTVRDAANALGKRVAFQGEGHDIRLDASVVHTLQDAMLQIVRNAVVHGIESGTARRAAGKAEQGIVEVKVVRDGRHVIVRCSDDGLGVDLDGLRQAARRKGITQLELGGLSADRLTELMLLGGLSTAATVTEVSGRGIGMDIVREAMAALGGRTTVQSLPGKGTIFELTLPMSLSSVEALAAKAGNFKVTIPTSAVEGTLRLVRRDIHHAPEGDTIVHAGAVLPFAFLTRFLSETDAQPALPAVSAIVLKGNRGRVAIGVEVLFGVSGIVLRSLPELAPASAIVAGVSLDIDSSPILMLDPDSLIDAVLTGGSSAPVLGARPKRLLVVDDSLTTRMLEKSILESAGYLVDTVNSAEEGLQQMAQTDYALVLVDIEMPGMDGVALVETIREDAALRHIPAILVTSLDSLEHRRRGEAAGAQGYVVKSEFDQTALLERIRGLGVLP